MTSPIDPTRKSSSARRAKKTAADIIDEIEGKAAPEGPGLPVPVSRARTIPPKTPIATAAQIEAQLLGERRGLRAGATVLDQAKTTYNRTEWSGSKDRRAPKGRAAKTKI